MRRDPPTHRNMGISTVSDRILIVDDDEDLAVMVSEYLGKAGLTVATAPTAAAGFEQLRQEAFEP